MEKIIKNIGDITNEVFCIKLEMRFIAKSIFIQDGVSAMDCFTVGCLLQAMAGQLDGVQKALLTLNGKETSRKKRSVYENV